jgi:putative tryptophan/tyrosine transport system substrate-binding protein
MRRRDFLPLAVAAITWNPTLAETTIPRIGFIQSGTRQENPSLLDAFHDGLAALGWTDGSNISIVDVWAEDRTERLPGLVKEVVGSGAVVLVTAGTAATLTAKRVSATIPIVLVGVADPVAIGVAASLTQPRDNVTGLSLTSSELIAKRLQLLQELVPGLNRLAVVVRNDPGLEQKLQDIRGNAKRMGIEVLVLEADTGKAIENAFMRLQGERCEAVYLASGPLGPAKRATIIALAAEARLPAIYSFRVFPVEGGLMAYGADYSDLFRRAAGYVNKILKGVHLADLPIEPPRKFDLTINLKTAKTLGLTVPPAILGDADEVIS